MSNSEKWYSIVVEAEISLLPSQESGRKTGITTGYRPNHNFGGAENIEMRMGQIIVENNEWIQPGETRNVQVHFIMPEGYVIDMAHGIKWRIQEGRRLIGTGKISKLISSEARSV